MQNSYDDLYDILSLLFGDLFSMTFEAFYTIGSCYKLNFGALIKQSNSHKRAVLDYLRKVHFKPLVNL